MTSLSQIENTLNLLINGLGTTQGKKGSLNFDRSEGTLFQTLIKYEDLTGKSLNKLLHEYITKQKGTPFNHSIKLIELTKLPLHKRETILEPLRVRDPYLNLHSIINNSPLGQIVLELLSENFDKRVLRILNSDFKEDLLGSSDTSGECLKSLNIPNVIPRSFIKIFLNESEVNTTHFLYNCIMDFMSNKTFEDLDIRDRNRVCAAFEVMATATCSYFISVPFLFTHTENLSMLNGSKAMMDGFTREALEYFYNPKDIATFSSKLFSLSLGERLIDIFPEDMRTPKVEQEPESKDLVDITKLEEAYSNVKLRLQDKAQELIKENIQDIETKMAGIKTQLTPLAEISSKKEAYVKAVQENDYMAVAEHALELSEADSKIGEVKDEVAALTLNFENYEVDSFSTETPVDLSNYVEKDVHDITLGDLKDAELKIQELSGKLTACYASNKKYESTSVDIDDIILDCIEGNASNPYVIEACKKLFPEVVFLEDAYYDGTYRQPQKLFVNLVRLCGKYKDAILSGTPDSTAKDILGSVYRANESKPTMSINEMARRRCFEVPTTEHEGKYDSFYFEQHLTLGSRRGEPYTIQVHFKIIEGVLYIGRIGPHLPSSTA